MSEKQNEMENLVQKALDLVPILLTASIIRLGQIEIQQSLRPVRLREFAGFVLRQARRLIRHEFLGRDLYPEERFKSEDEDNENEED